MIPKRLLIHSVEVQRPGEADRDGNIGAPIEWRLDSVRVVPTKAIVYTEAGITKADTLSLYYDPLNSESEPAGYIPQELDRIIWEGNEYTVHSVKNLYTQGTKAVHHYEAALV